ncbi:hypothetical protein SPRG_11944 [Saprolegnia parasitica CBS 223.65]|uniref:Uncharacterized protein n=1 Tax=Saprolegnia parasitica (strain CBS 223.65) TaxID=695850 RepID=A0A067C1U6_SAPPC|nr:hypothetical protein SPRG_11944 [Saprolegnia parasitica CBS 223.65]KDO23100.1 hypothetical protein SPRG_11944 [Saprolegnia parasitica CBS 223.65]|eukprot:XP_012206211.1 hypothetical protein SPRG_11944 [Saprolegnia parasitica CBS 223.65]
MASLLTEALQHVEMRTDVITGLSNELVQLDVKLQDAHFKAKQDPELGETVLQLYVAFLAKRDELIEVLQREKISVPWQLRMKIDEFEQSLKERKVKPYAKAADPVVASEAAPTSVAPAWERKDTLSVVVPTVVVLLALAVTYVMRAEIFAFQHDK